MARLEPGTIWGMERINLGIRRELSPRALEREIDQRSGLTAGAGVVPIIASGIGSSQYLADWLFRRDPDVVVDGVFDVILVVETG